MNAIREALVAIESILLGGGVVMPVITIDNSNCDPKKDHDIIMMVPSQSSLKSAIYKAKKYIENDLSHIDRDRIALLYDAFVTINGGDKFQAIIVEREHKKYYQLHDNGSFINELVKMK